MAASDTEKKQEKLQTYYNTISQTVLRFQSPTTGLFPVYGEDDSKVGDVRVSIYCALGIWSLHLAYKRLHCADYGRTYLLGQTAVKTMRGVLSCWMFQIPQMKKFLAKQIPENSLHVKFDIVTGQALKDGGYPHLQLDCISLFLLSLVQMISSGLQIIYTSDEVEFVQNLIYCIERAYRIADYGMWERGSKYNTGTPELNASNVGMAKAALEAVNGFNLFGEHGASWTVVYIDIDAHIRNKAVFEQLLPRESSSKPTDAALLPVLSWPFFATHDAHLKEQTLLTIVQSLKGRYGFKRYLRDGYGTLLEDRNAQFYQESANLQIFEGLECEWPFLTFFQIIGCIFRGDLHQANELWADMELMLHMTSQGVVVPAYYYVPYNHSGKTRGQGQRVATTEGQDDKYFLWGQSLYVVTRLLIDSLVPVNELDPIKRHLSASERPRLSHRYINFEASSKDRLIQIAVIAESLRLHQVLATHGVPSQTPMQTEPIQIWSPNQLKAALKFMGVNYDLELCGRPERPVGLLGTSLFYRVCGQTVICYPLLFEVNDFYISQDLNSVINKVQSDIHMLSCMWKLEGRPTYLIMITEAMVQSANARDLIDLLSSLKAGATCTGVRVKLDRLQSLVSSGTKEHLDFLTHLSEQSNSKDELNFKSIKERETSSTSELRVNLSPERVCQVQPPAEDMSSYTDRKLLDVYQSTEDISIKSQSLRLLSQRHGTEYLVNGSTICSLLENIRMQASHSSTPDWSVVRLCSALTLKVTDSLAPSITTLLVSGKLVALGLFSGEEEVISKPINPSAIGDKLYRLCQPLEPRETVLQQELILLLGQLSTTRPKLFDGILKLRLGWIVHAMQMTLACDTPGLSVYSLSPSSVDKLLLQLLQYSKTSTPLRPVIWKRDLLGSLGSVPDNFYGRLWYLLERSSKGIQLYDYHLPQQPTLSHLTVEEMSFAVLVEDMLSVVRDPVHRHVVVEVLTVVAVILERNPEVSFENAIIVEKILAQAISLFKAHTKSTESDDKVRVAFYNTPSDVVDGTYSYIAKAVCLQLLDTGISGSDCSFM